MTLGRAVAEVPVPLGGGGGDDDVRVEDVQVDAMAWIEGLKRGQSLYDADTDATSPTLTPPSPPTRPPKTQTKGAYTTARTVDGGRKIFRLSNHVQRLHDSARDLMAAEAGDAANAAADTPPLQAPPPPLPQLRAAAERVMARAVRRVTRGRRGQQQEEEEEVKLTLLLTWGAVGSSSPSFRLCCHAQALPPLPRPAVVRAVACGRPRANARAKDSAWVRERRAAVDLAKRAAAALDDARGCGGGHGEGNNNQEQTGGASPSPSPSPSAVEETLLVGEGGALEEGASSNFFALTKDGVLQTSGEDAVLPGTVRAVVLRVAREGPGAEAAAAAAWPVASVAEGRAPRLAEAGQWRACFLSSTSRQLLPVDELLDATDAAEAEAAGREDVPVPRVVFSSSASGGRGGDPGVAALVAAVRAAILADSEPLPLENES